MTNNSSHFYFRLSSGLRSNHQRKAHIHNTIPFRSIDVGVFFEDAHGFFFCFRKKPRGTIQSWSSWYQAPPFYYSGLYESFRVLWSVFRYAPNYILKKIAWLTMDCMHEMRSIYNTGFGIRYLFQKSPKSLKLWKKGQTWLLTNHDYTLHWCIMIM